MTGFEKLDRIEMMTEIWLGISAMFPLPMLIFRNGILVQHAGPCEALLGIPDEQLEGTEKRCLVTEGPIHDQNDFTPDDKGSVIYHHSTVGRRVAPTKIMRWAVDDLSYEAFLVLAGVRAIGAAKEEIKVKGRDQYVGT